MERNPRDHRDDSWRGVLADIERAATPRGRAGVGRFAIEGTRLHERALRAGARVETCLATSEFLRDGTKRVRDLVEDLETSGCRLHLVPDAVLHELTAGRSIGAIVGLVRTPEPPSLVRVVGPSDDVPSTLLVGVDVEDPGNVGAMVRTALASGAAGFVGVGITDPYHPKAVRVSMGSVFKLPILRFTSVGPLLDDLGRLGAISVGAVSTGGTPLPDLAPGPSPVAVFFGSEASGLADDVRKAMGGLVTVPMREGVDSYSINAAAAIVLYAIGSRRFERGDHPV